MVSQQGAKHPFLTQISPKYHNSSKNLSEMPVKLGKPYIFLKIAILQQFVTLCCEVNIDKALLNFCSIMGKTCAVGKCKVGYKGSKGQTVKKGPTIYSSPADEEECVRWIIALPNILPKDKDLSNIGVCERHWPPDFPTIRKKGSNRPALPAVCI